MRWAPSRTASRPMSTTFSQSPASIASRNALLPLVLVRSPTMSTPASCANGTAAYSDAAPGSTTGVARRDRAAADGLDDLPQVLRRRAAAAPDQAHAVLVDERRQRGGELVGLQRVLRAVLAQRRQPGVGHHRQGHGGVLRQVAQVLAHLGGAGGAVHADHVDAQRLERRERRADLRSEQHRAGELHRHLRDDRHPPAGRRHGALGADDRGLDLQQVLGGLDEHGVDAALEHRLALLLVGVAQPGVRRVARASAAWCPARPSRGPSAGARASTRRPPPPAPMRAPASAVSRMRSAMPYSASAARLEPNVLVSTASQPTAK